MQVGLYKILFYFEALVHESIIRALPAPTCIARTIAILPHVYCAIYNAPPTPLLYAIQHALLVMAMSCNGQPVRWARDKQSCACNAIGQRPEGRTSQGTPNRRGRDPAGDPHRGEGPTGDPPPEGGAQQGTPHRTLCADPGSGPSERSEHRPIEWGRRVCRGLSFTLGVARCGRTAGCVLCALWAVSAAVLGGWGTLWG